MDSEEVVPVDVCGFQSDSFRRTRYVVQFVSLYRRYKENTSLWVTILKWEFPLRGRRDISRGYTTVSKDYLPSIILPR